MVVNINEEDIKKWSHGNLLRMTIREMNAGKIRTDDLETNLELEKNKTNELKDDFEIEKIKIRDLETNMIKVMDKLKVKVE